MREFVVLLVVLCGEYRQLNNNKTEKQKSSVGVRSLSGNWNTSLQLSRTVSVAVFAAI